MKKIFILILITFTTIIFANNVSADMGPKSFIELEFKDISGDYYVTLLSKHSSRGPWNSEFQEEITSDHYLISDDPINGAKSWEAFRDYNDVDGYYFIEYFAKSNVENTFTWGYYPPYMFKALVYFPEDETFLISDIYEKYAFSNYFTVTSEDNNLVLTNNYDYTGEIAGLISRILITIFIEFIILLIFRLYRNKFIKVFIMTNVITQIFLNVMLNVIVYKTGAFILNFINPVYLLLELTILSIEALIYIFTAKDKSISKKLVLYAVVANITSFVIGYILINS